MSWGQIEVDIYTTETVLGVDPGSLEYKGLVREVYSYFLVNDTIYKSPGELNKIVQRVEDKLKNAAENLGANCIVGFKMKTQQSVGEGGDICYTITMYGTAVYVRKLCSSKKDFSKM